MPRPVLLALRTLLLVLLLGCVLVQLAVGPVAREALDLAPMDFGGDARLHRLAEDISAVSRAEEGQLSDEKWAAIAQDLVEDMGFVDPPTGTASSTEGEVAAPASEASIGAGGGRAPCR